MAVNNIAGEPALPVTSAEFAKSMAGIGFFEQRTTIAIALSGGADSNALALLALQWTKSRNGRLVALTVNHGLRPESDMEAQQVRQWCRERQIEHQLLTWTPPMLHSAVQEQARHARYQLLSDYCHQHAILHLLTAHHAGDQLETLLFRLASGSGLCGLACMPSMSYAHGIRLIRPLMHVTKERLITTLHCARSSWLEDPTNKNPAYMRARIRNHIEKEPDKNQFIAQGTAITTCFGKTRNLLEAKTVSYMTSAVFLFPAGYCRLDYQALSSAPPEIALCILASAIMAVNGNVYAPRLVKLRHFYEQCLNSATGRISFAGCLLEKKATYWLLHREPNAICAPGYLLPRQPMRWDNRFQVSYDEDPTLPPFFLLRMLGKNGMRQLKSVNHQFILLEKPVIPGLPSLWHLDELICVPHIGYVSSNFRQIRCRIRYQPRKPLAGSAFFMNNMGQCVSMEEKV